MKLNLSPGFILTQFGFTPENMAETIKATDDSTLVLDARQALRADLPALLPDRGRRLGRRQEAGQEHEKDGDMGHEWLKTNSAGSGPFKLRAWKPNESVALDANPDYWRGAPEFKRVVTRHIPEPATQRLLLEKGDIDIARKLTPEDLAAVAGNAGASRSTTSPKGAIWYMGLNQKNRTSGQARGARGAEVAGRLRRASSARSCKGKAEVHQTFLPEGFLGAIDDTPYKLDVAKAKELLAKAGLPDGFKVTMDTRNNSPTKDIAQAIQATWAQAGVKVEIIPADDKQNLTKYRARQHDIYIGQWGPDYQDPHTNAETFATNPDNTDDAQVEAARLAQRLGHPRDDQADPGRRARARRRQARRDLRGDPARAPAGLAVRHHRPGDRERSPRAGTSTGMIWGPSFDDNKYWQGRKE